MIDSGSRDNTNKADPDAIALVKDSTAYHLLYLRQGYISST